MSWRVVNIANEARLSLKNNQLIIKQDEECQIPLEDIGVLMLESQAISISSALLSACANHKISLLTCDEKHLPNGILTGYQNHSRQNKVITQQLSWTEPFRKRLWQKIVKQKIKNQAEAICIITGDLSKKESILIYEPGINSGDTTNREGAAARIYFSKLFLEKETRDTDNKTNAALNYGYAILRGVIARSLASYGFITSIGIKHDSELNQFNLADDIIEPFRPMIDITVFKEILNQSKEGELTKDDRIKLISILTKDCLINGNKQSVMRAIEMVVQSLSSATDKKDFDLLVSPEILIND